MRGKGLRALSLCKLYLKLFSEEKVYADGFVPYLVLVERWSMINFFFFPLCREWVCSKVQIRSAVPTIYWQSTHWATHMKSFHLHHTHRLTATWWVQACWKVSISLDIWVIIGLEHLDMFHADSRVLSADAEWALLRRVLTCVRHIPKPCMPAFMALLYSFLKIIKIKRAFLKACHPEGLG